MNKAELVARVARDTGLTKADVLRVLDGVLEQVVALAPEGGAGEARGLRDLPRDPPQGRGPRTTPRRASRCGSRPALAALRRRQGPES